ncbi:S9 family peptidase [Neiella marina]|uniref:S9 family peptidase n=1 Tax=Neiella holothuriorum TaxID=2870530 RepID=A0ABS7EJL7_9GAMM|nr:S9 family peptidase [Neiella holothuriorum]MBW8192520.1 S9 family peptidase [Neiella holothuriorum]
MPTAHRSFFSPARFNRLLARCSVALFASAMIVAPASAERNTSFSYTDLFELEYAAAPRITPDGDAVVYERRSMDIMTDRTRINLWQVNLDGSNHQPLFSGKANYRMARFSPDGSKMAYLASHEGDNQLYIKWLDSGRSARVTNLQRSPSAIVWSPDGKWLAFTMFTPEPAKPLFTDMPKAPKGAKWAGAEQYIDSTLYRSNNGGYAKSGFSQIYVVPAEGGTPRQLTFEQSPIGGPLAWTADSSALILSADRHEDWELRPLESDLYRLDVASAELTQLTSKAGPESAPSLSPNGKWLAFLNVDDRKLGYQVSRLAIMSPDGKKQTLLTGNLDRSVNRYQWAADNSGLYVSYDDQGTRKLAFVSLKGDIKRLDVRLGGQSLGRPYTSGDFRVSDSGDIVFSQSDTKRPADLAVLTKRGKTRQLTHLNQDLLDHKPLAEVKIIKVKSSVDKRDIGAWVALPPNFDSSKKYPLILEIHGGPHAAYGPNFSAEVQLMAAAGYVVVWANPRGSSSYGEEFANLIHHNYPSDDYQDLMDVVDTVIAQGYIDSSQLFVTGGSGGGVLTAWIVGKTDRFAAAVVAKPVINWLSFALTADMYPYFSQYWMPGKPWEIADHLWQHSPLSLVGNVTTPTMLLTGEVDYRTPMSETEQYYQALRLQQVDSALVRIAEAHHGIAAKPSNLIRKIGNILAWFEKYQSKPAE